MRLYKRGSTWWIAIGDIRETTGCKDKTAAQLVFARRQRELADPHHAAKDQATLPDAVDTFLTTLRKTRRDDGSPVPAGTINMYECKTGHLLRLLPARLAELTVPRVEEHFATREEEGASHSTMYKEWVALSRVLQLAAKRDLFGDVRKLKPDWLTATSTARETFLTHEEIPRLLAALEPHRRQVVAFILATGARWSEAMRFQLDDLDRTTWTVRIRGTKTKGSAKPIVVPEMYRGLLDHVAGPFEPWSNVRRDLQVAARRADVELAASLPHDAPLCPVIPTITPNDLRRTFASLLVQAGTPLDVVAKLLRHASTAMVYRVYGQHTPESLAKLAGGGESSRLSAVRLLYRTPESAEENTDNADCPDSASEAMKALENRAFGVGRAGHDPATYGLKVRSSTN